MSILPLWRRNKNEPKFFRFGGATKMNQSVRALSTLSKRILATALPLCICDIAHAEMASVYGKHDGLCGSRTANGERLNCAAMTAAHRTLPFGTHVVVCHNGCVTVRINDRGPWVRGRHFDLSPAAARAIGLNETGHVTISGRKAADPLATEPARGGPRDHIAQERRLRGSDLVAAPGWAEARPTSTETWGVAGVP
jgi:rare lipoprotein A